VAQIIFNDIAVMLEGLVYLILSLVQNFGETEMCWHALGIEPQGVLEVFLGFAVVPKIRQLGG